MYHNKGPSPYSSFASPRMMHSMQNSSTNIKLGGPNTINANKLNSHSRQARAKNFTHEHQQAFAGQGVPGPAEYVSNRIHSLNTKYHSGRKSSIPKARREVGYTKLKVDRRIHYGVAHLTNQVSPASNMHRVEPARARCLSHEEMQSYEGHSSTEAMQMTNVLQKGKPSICYQDNSQHIRCL